ncbi:inosine/xanthosine triphosphatase OS=Ureibacillus acetophenoni OX=614649 GN=SAMN05877842_102552 PE=4 SV=1 [Ureibacillus acetophenoni]
MLVSIGTKNRAKSAAITNILNNFFEQVEYIQLDVPSNVSAQPLSDEETRQGAINRAINSLKQSGAELNFGLEGGVRIIDGSMYCCNWGALALKDGTVITAAGALFLLPESIANEIRSGKELGPVMDAYTNEKGIRHGKGAIGVFTENLVDRTEMFEHIVKLLIGQYLYMKNHA